MHARRRAAKSTTGEVDPSGLGPEQAGLIVVRHGATVTLRAESQALYHCQLRQNLGDVVCGDHVIWQAFDTSGGIVTAVEPRQTVLGRPDRLGDLKPLAANIDQMLIVLAALPTMQCSLLDSYLVAAERLGIKPVIVFNKTDLLDSQDLASITGLLDYYARMDYSVIYTKYNDSSSTALLNQQLSHLTSVFVGQSGVGKSTLINGLLPGESIRTGELSEGLLQGMHTTTTARWYQLDAESAIIDSPGIREFGLWKMTPNEIAQGFADFRPYLGYCKFRDCRHMDEPNCAIIHAHEKGDIITSRLESFRQLAY